MTSGTGPDRADHWIDRLASAPSRRMLVSLIERLEGAGLVCGYLGARGADPSTIARLLEEPIPTGLASRLAALSTSRST